MIIIHEIFNCKPGNASKNVNILINMAGQSHRLIIASSFENLTAYEEGMKTMGQSEEEKKVMERFKDMNEMYVSNSREIFKLW